MSDSFKSEMDLDFLNLSQMGYFDVVEAPNDFFDSDTEFEEIEVPDGCLNIAYGEMNEVANSHVTNVNPVKDFDVIEAVQYHPTASAPHSKTPTFVSINEDQKENFVLNMRNKNTTKKTQSSVKQFQRWLAEPPRNDNRQLWKIMPAELDNLIGLFLLSIRKADGAEHETDSLTSYHRGLDR